MTTLVVRGQLGIGGISRIQDFLNRIRQGLMDDCPELYRLDEPVHQWTNQQFYTYLREAQDRINNTGPRRTFYEIESFPIGQDEFLVTGAKIWALYARSRLEKANEMTYSDLHSLDIKRADFYKSLADQLYRDWIESIVSWKRSTPPTPIGINSQRLPFRIFRVLGLMPNYQTFFSG